MQIGHESFNLLTTAANLSAVGLSPIFHQSLEFEKIEKVFYIAAKERKELTTLNDDLQKLGVSEELIADVVRDVELISWKLTTVPPQVCRMSRGYRKINKQPFSSVEEQERLIYEKYFEEYFGYSMNEKDICCIQDREYLVDYCKVFIESEPKIVANYMFWRAGRKFLEQKFPRKLILRHFFPVIIAAGFSTYFTADDENKLQKALSILLNSLLKIKHEFSLGAEGKTKAYIKGINDNVQYKNSHYQQEIIDKEYDALKIDPENFFKNITVIRKFPTTKSEMLLCSDGFSNLWDFLFDSATRDHNKPMLYHMINTCHYQWYNVIKSFKTDFSDPNKYPDSVINNQMQIYNVPENYQSTARKSKANALALKQVMVDYKIWLKDNEELANAQDTILSKFNLDNNKLLFVAFAQIFRESDVNLRSELILTLWNSADFSAAFSCKLGSKMNPKGNYSI